MRIRTIDLLILIALIVATHYYFAGRQMPQGVVEKGVCVGTLALWAGLQARTLDGWLIAAVMACGALGDVLIETDGMTPGALAFLAGHAIAVVLYLRNRSAWPWFVVPVATLIACAAWLMPADRGAATGISVYALGLGAMAGAALISRFPGWLVGLGALLFVLSDMLIFSRMGPLHRSTAPGLLIWPTYFAAQALVAWGVVATLREERP